MNKNSTKISEEEIEKFTNLIFYYFSADQKFRFKHCKTKHEDNKIFKEETKFLESFQSKIKKLDDFKWLELQKTLFSKHQEIFEKYYSGKINNLKESLEYSISQLIGYSTEGRQLLADSKALIDFDQWMSEVNKNNSLSLIFKTKNFRSKLVVQ